jgi:anti-sigma regulatory factor (Ser/Thr protein kinase)
MRMAFPKRMASLPELLDSVTLFLEEHKVDEEASFAMSLGIDEIFSNFVRHQTVGKQDVDIEMRIENGNVKAVMQDHDVDEYDFTKKEPADMDKLAAEASPGGRGLFLTMQLLDTVEYAYANRTCIVTLTKRLRSPSV